ncbi:hypothetical protein KIPB_006083, partial [Kipferlia bialata]
VSDLRESLAEATELCRELQARLQMSEQMREEATLSIQELRAQLQAVSDDVVAAARGSVSAETDRLDRLQELVNEQQAKVEREREASEQRCAQLEASQASERRGWADRLEKLEAELRSTQREVLRLTQPPARPVSTHGSPMPLQMPRHPGHTDTPEHGMHLSDAHFSG